MMPIQLAFFAAGALLAAPSGPQDPAEQSILPVPTQEGESVDLSLEQALRIALRRDLGLQIQELDTEIARYQYDGTWGAFDPVVTAGGSVTDGTFQINSSIFNNRSVDETTLQANLGLLYPLTTGGSFEFTIDHRNIDTSDPFAQLNQSTTDNFALVFNQPLLRGAGTDYNTSLQRQAELGYLKQLETYRETRQDLLRRVSDAYWDLVAALRQREVADLSVELSKEQLDQNRRRLDAGVGTEVEVLQSRADLAASEEQRLLRMVAVEDAEDLLKTTLFPGDNVIYWSLDIVPVTELPEISTTNLPGWKEAMQVALERRPVLRRTRLDIDIAEQSLVRATSERRAALDLNLSSSSRGFNGNSGDAFRSAAQFEFPTHRAGVTFSVPIGNRAAGNAERAARSSLRAARLSYDAQETFVVSDVRAAHRQVIYAAEVVVAANKTVDLAQRQLEAEQSRYREGLATNFEVLSFQRDLTDALFSLTAAEAAFAKAQVRLRRAQGLLGEAD